MTNNSNDIFTYHTLANGLRIVHRASAADVEHCGVAIKAGSRNESSADYGLAHFVEHTIFKGTDRRRSWHIVNRMESVGGEINAYTSEEVTMLYSCFPKGNLTRAVELMADLIGYSRFPENEIYREREVVLDEIDSYLDSPSDAIFDDFNDLIFAGSSLGHNILGTAETIETFTPESCRDFLSTHYTPGNMVFFYTGPTAPSRVMSTVERHLGFLNHSVKELHDETPREVTPFDIRKKLGTHQSHTVIGARIPGIYSRSNHTYALLNNIIGGPCMNSRLNVLLRERHGYVYSVDSYISSFTDCGLFTVYFGCDENHVKPCRRLIFRTLDELAQSTMSTRALDAAKKQYLGQTIVAGANAEQVALATGRSTLFHRHALHPHEIIERIMGITPEDIRLAAEKLTPSRCSILTFGQ